MSAIAHLNRRRAHLCALPALTVAVVLALAVTTTASASHRPPEQHKTSALAVRVWTIHYRAHDGADRHAYIVLPAWYGPRRHPAIPLVISPHGRGGNGRANADFWGNMPAFGRFAVVNPDGMGRRLARYSYGYQGQIDDLAKMPEFAVHALPWLRIDRRRIYALGSSMGGQETLLLVARHPTLLAGAAAMDSVTDLSRRYDQVVSVPCDRRCVARWGTSYGRLLQSAMRREVGGTPAEVPNSYAARSPLRLARDIAFAGVPLQVWWSKADRIVFDQRHQSRKLFDAMRRLNACAAVTAYVGTWEHSKEMRASSLLPIALAGFHLLPPRFRPLPSTVHHVPAAACASNSRVGD